MAYDEHLAERVRAVLGDRDGVTAKRMFGGIAFMVHGNMACGVLGDDLVLRVGPAKGEEILREPHTRPMDFTGRPMRGFVYVSPEATGSEHELRCWVALGADHATSLPRKR